MELIDRVLSDVDEPCLQGHELTHLLAQRHQFLLLRPRELVDLRAELKQLRRKVVTVTRRTERSCHVCHLIVGVLDPWCPVRP
jgi:hypothetical protein